MADDLLNANNSVLIFIDHQPQMAFGVSSIDRQLLKNNVVGLAKTGALFKAPTILTSVETKSFSGYIWPELLKALPDVPVIERSSMNSWEDEKFVAAVKKTGRKKLIISALWTEVCLTFPALCARKAGYEVYICTDTSGGQTKEAHDNAVTRMVQAGCVPVTWQQVMLEYQRDWARKETYNGVTAIVKEHCGAYGMGIEYAYTMVHKQPPTGSPSSAVDGNAKH